jgi:hypothetical protein
MLPATGLITSGPISSGPLNSSGAPKRKVSGSLDSAASMKLRATSFAHNPAVTTVTTEGGGFAIKGCFAKCVLGGALVILVAGSILGVFILAAVHNAIMLIVMVAMLGAVAALLSWNVWRGKRGVIGYVNRYPDADLRTTKDGEYVKVTGVCEMFLILLIYSTNI